MLDTHFNQENKIFTMTRLEANLPIMSMIIVKSKLLKELIPWMCVGINSIFALLLLWKYLLKGPLDECHVPAVKSVFGIITEIGPFYLILVSSFGSYWQHWQLLEDAHWKAPLNSWFDGVNNFKMFVYLETRFYLIDTVEAKQ